MRVSDGSPVEGVAVDGCHESWLGREATAAPLALLLSAPLAGVVGVVGAGIIIDRRPPPSLAGPASVVEVSRPTRVAGTSKAVAVAPAEIDASELPAEGSLEAAKLGGSEGVEEARGRRELAASPAVGIGRRATRGCSDSSGALVEALGLRP